MKVRFLIRSLQRGGAERQCVALAKGLRQLGHDVGVLVFYSGGDLYDELLAAGIPVESVGKLRRWELVGFLQRIRRCLRRERPDVVYSLLQVSNVVAAVEKLFVPTLRVTWGIRTASMDLTHYDRLVRVSYWLEARLSRFADHIIVNSEAGLRYAKVEGYRTDRISVIPNGIDTELFAPDRSKGKTVRCSWGIRDEEVVIGLVGRLDPIKDHPTFLRAAALVVRQCPLVKFVCIGGGDSAYKESLVALCAELALSARVIWAGEHSDMPAVYNALDVACLTSTAEGCPNTLLEAMACGVLCVATDVGDSKRILGEIGGIVPSRNSEALAGAIQELLRMDGAERAKQGQMGRDRVIQHFSLDRLIGDTASVLEATAR